MVKVKEKSTVSAELDKLRLLVAREILRNQAYTKDRLGNISEKAASAELYDQYCLKVFLNWLATKYGFPRYIASMQSDKQAVQSLPGGWSAFEHIYPFYWHFDEQFELDLQEAASVYLDGTTLEPRLEDAGTLYMQTMVSALDVNDNNGGEVSLRPAGKLRRAGQFYTHPAIVDYCLKQTRFVEGDKTLLDPACGTGNFLLGALYQTDKRLSSLDKLYGFDIDGKAVSIARVLLLFACSSELQVEWERRRHSNFNSFLQTLLAGLCAHLRITDATVLVPDASKQFDIVAGNPPYISFGSRNQQPMALSHDRFLRSAFPAASQYKIRMHSIFQELALRLAAPTGEVVLLLPDAFLSGAYYERLRRYIENAAKIVSFTELPESTFADATAGRWCIAHYRKQTSTAPYVVTLRRVDALGAVQQFALDCVDLLSRDKARFRLIFDERDLSILRNLDRLPPLSSAFRGHTGIRARRGQASIVADCKQSPRFRPGIISGGQVKHHSIEWRGHYLNIDPALLFGGGYDDRIIGSPKVLLRQTADRLVAAVDNAGLYHLNNVHSFAPADKQDAGSCAFLAALMNSRLWLYLYQLKSREQKRALAQIDIEMVESLPLPHSDHDLERAIEQGVEVLCSAASRDQIVMRAIDRLIYDLYRLNPEEVGHIEQVADGDVAALPSSAEAFHLLKSVNEKSSRR